MTAQASVGTLRLGGTLGITSKLSLFGMVPIVRQQVQVDYGFDSTGANVGYNPADPVFGTAAGADSVNTFLVDYRTALDTLGARIAGGYYVDPDSLALAEATLASGTAYWAGLDSLFSVTGAAGSFVPLAGERRRAGHVAAVSGTQANLAALGVPSFAQPLPLPADALSPSDYNAYLTNSRRLHRRHAVRHQHQLPPRRRGVGCVLHHHRPVEPRRSPGRASRRGTGAGAAARPATSRSRTIS